MSKLVPVLPDGWVRPRGYSNGVLGEGRLLFVAGQIGWNPRMPEPTFPEGFAEQFELALANVLEVVTAAGGTPESVARLTVYVTDKREYLASLTQVGEAWRRQMGKHYPAMALVEVQALVEDQAKVEMEATAVL